MSEHEFEDKSTDSHAKPRRPEAASADGTSQAARALAALASGRTVSPAAVNHLQRTAGNAAVAELLEPERSPVLDVVGHGGGQPLDADTKSFMEARMGTDFSDVRIHTDARAAESARAVEARAYTVGTDIVFDGDTFDPGSNAGRRMLAHELTHVGQQTEGEVDGTPAAGGISISDPSDRFELAADANADRVMAGGVATTAAGGLGGEMGGAALQRLSDEEDVAGGEAGGPAVQREEAEEEEDQSHEG